MTDKELKAKIIAEIERLSNFTKGYYADRIASGYKICCSDITAFINSIPEEPVSEDLEEAAKRYATEGDEETGGLYIIDEEVDAFKAGAKWKEQQFEKNRLAHCNAQTEEEAEREQDFVMGIIDKEHRQPTFDDAIKYGMRLQKEELMAKAIEGKVLANGMGNPILHLWDKGRHLIDKKVKVIIIKEE